MSKIYKVYFKGWRKGLEEFLLKTKEELTIVSPYITITEKEAQKVVNILQKTKCKKITIITKLEASNLGKSLDIKALKILGKFSKDSKVINLPELHAKIYVSDKKRAIITSANLTFSGLGKNYECGIGITDESAGNSKSAVGQICTKIEHYIKKGINIEANELDSMVYKASIAVDVEPKQSKLQRSKARKTLDNEFRRFHSTNDMNMRFEKAVYYSLVGGKKTKTQSELEEEIERLYHPNLCRGSWKDKVKKAQDSLKKHGIIFCKNERWRKNKLSPKKWPKIN